MTLIIWILIYLKTRKNWYDWHWQAKITCKQDVSKAYDKLRNSWWLIIEKMIDLDSEASVIVARDRHGNVKSLNPIFNIHEWWILRQSIIPAPINPIIEKELISQATKLMSRWKDYVWILTVEFFVDKNWKVYINELAPRTHNSWHATLDYGWASQNDLWMDAVSWRTLQVLEWIRAVVMSNILSQWDLAFQILLYNSIDFQLWHWFLNNWIWERIWVNLTWVDYTNLYDYLKVWDEVNSKDNLWKIRKLWHTNMVLTDEMKHLIDEIRSWRKSREEFFDIVKRIWTVKRI